MDVEVLLIDQDSMASDCTGCPYASVEKCKSQCMEEELYVFDPDLFKYVKVSERREGFYVS